MMNLFILSAFSNLAMGGILGDAFGKLFKVIWDAIVWVGKTIWGAIEWLGKLLKNLFQGLLDLLVSFFQVIYDLIAGLLYLLYKIGVIAAKLFQIIFETAKLLYSLVVGFARTLASLTYAPQSSSGHGYSEVMGKLFTMANDSLQLKVFGGIMLFAIWIGTAVGAMKLISSIRVGGD